MKPKANAPGSSRGAAKKQSYSEIVYPEYNSSKATKQTVSVVRVVGAYLENYATRQLALRRYGRAI